MVTCTLNYPNGNTLFTCTISPREILLASLLLGVLVQFAILLPSVATHQTHEGEWHSFQLPAENRLYQQHDGAPLYSRDKSETSQADQQQLPILAGRDLQRPLSPQDEGDFLQNVQPDGQEGSELDDDDSAEDDDDSADDDDDNHRPERVYLGWEAMQLPDSTPSPDFHHHLAQKDDDGFAACLLIMDDNHYLIEWLAYHYHFLPLRRLIVAVDPASRTSPREIFDRYRHLINITVWGDEEVFQGYITQDTPLFRHRKRQRYLLSRCLMQLKDEGRRWVANIDTDEFLTIHSGASRHYKVHKRRPTLYQTLDDPANNNAIHRTTTPCITVRREQMSYRPSPSRWDDASDRPWAWADFNTLRQRSRSRKTFPAWAKKGGRVLAPKTIINVRRINEVSVRPGIVGPHRPSRLCRAPTAIVHPYNATYIVQHYPGTLEQFNYRSAGDPREDIRSTSRYFEEFNLTNAGETDDLPYTWIDEFVKKVGMSLAKTLLEGIGRVEELPPRPLDDTSWVYDEGNGPSEDSGDSEDESDDEDTAISLKEEDAKPMSQSQHTEESSPSKPGIGLSDTGLKLWNNLAEPDFHHHMRPEDGDGFAACLLIMDDNHYLIEWLAYHYLFLPLRRLIIAVDPASRTSPQEILDRYQHLINITLWGDDQVFEGWNVPDNPLFRHRKRQKFVLSSCLKQLKEENRTWVAAVDTDEFVAVHSGAQTSFLVKQKLPTMYQMLEREENDNPVVSTTSPCITMRRSQMSNRASPPLWGDDPKRPWAWSDFNTLRQRFRSHKTYPVGVSTPRVLGPKAIVNAQRVTKISLRPGGVGPHRPSRLCTTPSAKIHPYNATYIVHHYPGTLAQFNFRSALDPRENVRSEQRYWDEFNLTKSTETNDVPWTWVDDFVQHVGLSLAKKLLKGIGTVETPLSGDVQTGDVDEGDDDDAAEVELGDDDEDDDELEGEQVLQLESQELQLLNEPSKDFHYHLDPQDGDGFSACLLIMDDNHYLIEWLAYHYHFLPLRRLIVAVDPASRTSPKEVLDRYRNLINVTIWGDETVFEGWNIPDNPLFRHRKRQKFVMSRCMKQLKVEGRTWAAAVDTDEYLAVHSGATRTYLVKKKLPTLYQMVEEEANTNPLIPRETPCISIRREQMSNRASESRWREDSTRPWQWANFNTLGQRFRSRHTVGRKSARVLGPKAVVHVGRVTGISLRPGGVGPHRPSRMCREPNNIINPFNATYIVQHYPGTLEQFSFRDAGDPRESIRSQNRYWDEFNLTKSIETNDVPWTWVDDFVSKVGMPLAEKLLKGIGQVEKIPPRSKNDTSWVYDTPGVPSEEENVDGTEDDDSDDSADVEGVDEAEIGDDDSAENDKKGKTDSVDGSDDEV